MCIYIYMYGLIATFHNFRSFCFGKHAKPNLYTPQAQAIDGGLVGLQYTGPYRLPGTLKRTAKLGGGFKHFLFSLDPGGKDPIWRAYFSSGLKPPTTEDLKNWWLGKWTEGGAFSKSHIWTETCSHGPWFITFSHLKMDGWKMILSFWDFAYFQVRNCCWF